ncbi:Ribosylnicotinamide kinase [Rubrivivax sp. A210]|uniref:AAA family ATPase n=1 Tax=Rubrivivax sp. A210 TaxID=2772301 RepID=UPI00191B448A|nr:ATP-binding protein [Rubrivivax sp. A210]CAD5374572.1 Ribosylnicotinamide kinase [Rubrivivax sp. A210]
MPALRIAIVGAESTGKTTLAQTLAARLGAETGRRVAWVPELLREWCEQHGRTPLQQEQAPLARSQHVRIAAAAAAHDIVVCDTTALMTAVYSRIVFGDRSLDAEAAELHRSGVALTLLTALDLPWVADGLQRDGPHVRQPVDDALRELLLAQRLPFAVVAGAGERRIAHALAAVAPLLRGLPEGSATRRGLFTGLGEPGREARCGWACECCDPASEQALLRQR